MAGSKQGVHVIWIAIDFLARVVWGIFKKKIDIPAIPGMYLILD